MKIKNKTLVKVTNKDIDKNGIFAMPKEICIIGEEAFKNCVSLKKTLK